MKEIYSMHLDGFDNLKIAKQFGIVPAYVGKIVKQMRMEKLNKTQPI